MLKLALNHLTLEIRRENYVVQSNTVPNNCKYVHVYQDMIHFENNKKLIMCLATTVSCEFNWLYHADLSLKQKISLFD